MKGFIVHTEWGVKTIDLRKMATIDLTDKPTWKELERLSVEIEMSDSVERKKADRYMRLLQMTFNVDMHPEWYQGHCQCKECRSYGD